jgi:hypothetical protein
LPLYDLEGEPLLADWWTSQPDPPFAPLPTVTIDHIAARPAEKAALQARFGAALVEMEGYAIARIATAAGVPWVVLRAALDGPEEDISGLPGPEGSLPQQLRFAARRPRTALRLQRRLAQCARALAAAAHLTIVTFARTVIPTR